MTGITVSHHGDTLVAVKQADEPDARARLRQEATVLAKLDHPGVVRLVGFDEGPPATLRTSFVGPDSWAHHLPAGDACFDGLAAVVATVADLHDAGVAHGSLVRAHVLVGADGRPILCGLGDAGPASPAGVDADRLALATLVRDIDSTDPLLVEAAADLENPTVALRSVVRRLDTRTVAPTPGPRRLAVPQVSRRVLTIVGAVLAVTFVGMAAAAALGGGTPEAATPAPPTSIAPTTTTQAPTTTTAPTTTVDPAAPIVEHAGRRYAIGAPGDLVTLGDWTCDGVATPAVLRPDTGSVAVFTEWPAPDAQITASIVTTVDGASAFVVSDEPCPDLRVQTAGGSRLIPITE